MQDQDRLNEAVLTITGGVDWEIFAQGLHNDIYHVQANILEAPSWDEVCEARGFCKGLAYVISMRDSTLLAMQQAEEDKNADV